MNGNIFYGFLKIFPEKQTLEIVLPVEDYGRRSFCAFLIQTFAEIGIDKLLCGQKPVSHGADEHHTAPRDRCFFRTDTTKNLSVSEEFMSFILVIHL